MYVSSTVPPYRTQGQRSFSDVRVKRAATEIHQINLCCWKVVSLLLWSSACMFDKTAETITQVECV